MPVAYDNRAASSRKLYITFLLTELMTTQVPVKSRFPPRPGNHIENGIAKQAVKDYIQTLVPQLLVFFSIQNVGLRPLRYFCAEVLQFTINIQEIEQVILQAGRKAEQKLAPLDLKAGELVRTIEVDATWKGRFHKFLAAIAREGNYLFCLEHVKNEGAAAVRPALQRVSHFCCNLRLVVTDMALGFAEVIPRIFRGIVHLFCHNHMLKAVDREMPELRKDFSGAIKRLEESKGPARTVNKWLRRNRSHLYNARSYRKKLQGQKFHLCQERGIPVKLNGALKATRRGLPPFLRPLSERIYGVQGREDRFRRQVSRQLAKRAKVGKARDLARVGYSKAWHRYASFRQIWAQFRQLLKTTDLRLFRRQQKKLQRRLDKSPNKMTRKIAEYLGMPQLRRLFRFSPEERVALGPINTNHVEGFFAQMRVTLDGLRNAPDTPYVRARLVLLRYWHNVVGPLSGSNVGLSPCRQLGIALRPGNPIQAICVGAPLPKKCPDFGNWETGTVAVRA
jgi:hypothetical protein